MNYINNFSISGSTYACTPFVNVSSDDIIYILSEHHTYSSIAIHDNIITYYNTISPPSYISRSNVYNNLMLNGNVSYSPAWYIANDAPHTESFYTFSYDSTHNGDMVSLIHENHYIQSIKCSVVSNYAFIGSYYLEPIEYSRTLDEYSLDQGSESNLDVRHYFSLDFRNNILFNAKLRVSNTGYISSMDESSSIEYNCIINSDKYLAPGEAHNVIINSGNSSSIDAGMYAPSIVTDNAPLLYSDTFIGGGEKTLNTSGRGTFIGGNNFYTTVTVTGGEYKYLSSDRRYPSGAVIPVVNAGFSIGAPGVYEWKSNSGTIWIVRGSSDADGYYSESYSMSCAVFGLDSESWFAEVALDVGNRASDSYWGMKPIIYDISVQNNTTGSYGRWLGAVGLKYSAGYHYWHNDSYSEVFNPNAWIHPSYEYTYNMAGIGISLYTDGFGAPTPATPVYTDGEDDRYRELIAYIGFIEPTRPHEYNATWYYFEWVNVKTGSGIVQALRPARNPNAGYSTSIGKYWYVAPQSFHYVGPPQLVIHDGRGDNYTLRIHAITTN